MYSGVNTGSFQKHINSQELTAEGLKRLGPTVIRLVEVEGLDAHAESIRVRMEGLGVKIDPTNIANTRYRIYVT
jgi:phosphoribosyl-ATP pyrophosphohydrolase / phosphoribosyl-AMP cyclohydrolase / histidinol dehydrogenase